MSIIKRRNDTFVCVDDITGYPVEMNHVIYNPSKDSTAFRTELLYKTIKESFNVELSSDELIELTSYDVYELDTFIERLKNIINKKKK